MTPKTDAAMFSLDDGTEVTKAHVARELERELNRALRVVEAAKRWRQDECGVYKSSPGLEMALDEWGAGR